MSKWTKNEQQLVDLVFDVGMMAATNRQIQRLDQQQKAEWIAKQLELCGFPTKPVGASWGILQE